MSDSLWHMQSNELRDLIVKERLENENREAKLIAAVDAMTRARDILTDFIQKNKYSR